MAAIMSQSGTYVFGNCTGCPGVPSPGPARPTAPNEVEMILRFIGNQKQMVSAQWLISQIKKGAHLNGNTVRRSMG